MVIYFVYIIIPPFIIIRYLHHRSQNNYIIIPSPRVNTRSTILTRFDSQHHPYSFYTLIIVFARLKTATHFSFRFHSITAPFFFLFFSVMHAFFKIITTPFYIYTLFLLFLFKKQLFSILSCFISHLHNICTS